MSRPVAALFWAFRLIFAAGFLWIVCTALKETCRNGDWVTPVVVLGFSPFVYLVYPWASGMQSALVLSLAALGISYLLEWLTADGSTPEYTIVQHKSIYDVDRLVNERLRKGWQPLGGITYDPERGMYLQAINKKGK